MVFRQLFDADMEADTYLLADADTHAAVRSIPAAMRGAPGVRGDRRDATDRGGMPI